MENEQIVIAEHQITNSNYSDLFIFSKLIVEENHTVQLEIKTRFNIIGIKFTIIVQSYFDEETIFPDLEALGFKHSDTFTYVGNVFFKEEDMVHLINAKNISIKVNKIATENEVINIENQEIQPFDSKTFIEEQKKMVTKINDDVTGFSHLFTSELFVDFGETAEEMYNELAEIWKDNQEPIIKYVMQQLFQFVSSERRFGHSKKEQFVITAKKLDERYSKYVQSHALLPLEDGKGECPVCGMTQAIDSNSCKKCGATFVTT